jgi:RND family efflux transporter MFP subunit
MKLVSGVVFGVIFNLLMIAVQAVLAGAEPIVLDGLIEPSMVVNVGSSVPGILESVDIERGDMVKKGQVLARLHSGVEMASMELARFRTEMKAAIKEKQAQVDFSVRRQKRYKELYNKKVIPFEEMDEARTNSKLAFMALEEVRENIRLAELELKRSIEVVKRITIYSPIAGVVMERLLFPGEYVEDQPVIKLAQIHPLYVEIFAPVELLGTIKIGMHAEVTPEKPVERVYKARVKIVDRVVDAASGTFGVRLELPNPEYGLPAGLKCTVTFHK